MTEQAATLYLIHQPFGLTDVGGCLMTEAGEVLWSHVSSDLAWLEGDLTRNFGRSGRLAERFPNGYRLVVRTAAETPAWLRDANHAWARRKDEDDAFDCAVRDLRAGDLLLSRTSIFDDNLARVVAVGPAGQVFPTSCCRKGHAAHDDGLWHVALASEIYPDTFPEVFCLRPASRVAGMRP